MLWINTKRVLRSGFVNFWRNGFVSLASVLVMVITLAVIGSVIFTGAFLETSLTELKSKVDINVNFVTTASETDVLEVKKSLEKLPEVASATYISREQVKADFQQRHEHDQLLLQALNEVGDNPFGATVTVQAKNPGQYQSISAFLKSDSDLSRDGSRIIAKSDDEQNAVAIDRLTKIIDSTNQLGLILTIVLVIISVIITFNTIRLTIYVSREEIAVMRLVGASNKYIRGPFVVSGIMYGLVAALITLIAFYPVTFYVRKITMNFFNGIDLFHYYLVNFGQVFLIVVGSGIVIGAISSYMAVRRYLKI